MSVKARRPAPITLSAIPCLASYDEQCEEPFGSKYSHHQPSKYLASDRECYKFGPLQPMHSWGSSSTSSADSEPGSPPLEHVHAGPSDDLIRSYSRAVQEVVRVRQFGIPELQVPAELLPYLYLGDASAAMDTETLHCMGIDAIVNCASGAVLTNREYYDASFEYVEFEAEDHPDYDLLGRHFEETRAFLDECYRNNKKALVHCAAGINRSATLCVAYYMVTTNTDLITAVKHCFALRPIILCNESFINQLVRFAYHYNLLDASN